MEAATRGRRALTGDKATRIVDAMRSSVAELGAAGATFDHVAREAGVSRGLLHYYFATKERLLVEVVRRDCDMRMQALEARLAQARSADDFVAELVTTLGETVSDDPCSMLVVFELFTLSRRHDDVAVEFEQLLRRVRAQVADLLRSKDAEGVLHLRADAEAVVDVIFSLGDGLAMRLLSEPGRDLAPTIRAAGICVRTLLDDPV